LKKLQGVKIALAFLLAWLYSGVGWVPYALVTSFSQFSSREGCLVVLWQPAILMVSFLTDKKSSRYSIGLRCCCHDLVISLLLLGSTNLIKRLQGLHAFPPPPRRALQVEGNRGCDYGINRHWHFRVLCFVVQTLYSSAGNQLPKVMFG
jgi:hypothetical protein